MRRPERKTNKERKNGRKNGKENIRNPYLDIIEMSPTHMILEIIFTVIRHPTCWLSTRKRARRDMLCLDVPAQLELSSEGPVVPTAFPLASETGLVEASSFCGICFCGVSFCKIVCGAGTAAMETVGVGVGMWCWCWGEWHSLLEGRTVGYGSLACERAVSRVALVERVRVVWGWAEGVAPFFCGAGVGH